MLRARLVSAAVLIPLVVIVLFLGQPWLGLLIVVVAGLAAREVFPLLRGAGIANEPILGVVAAVVIAAGGWLLSDSLGETWILVGLAVVVAALGAFLRPDPRDGFQVWLGTVFGAIYVGMLGFLLLIVEGAPTMPSTAPLAPWLGAGQAWLIVCVLGVWAFDTGAYAAGRTWGRRGFMVHISPKKTLEGVIGGVVGATLVTALTLWLAGADPLGALVLGPMIAIAAQAGDLAESLIKRAAGAKDSGNLIPGHGGMLDRVDSIIFAAPIVYFYILVLGALG
ncbi:MAG TPA: phosphatidate cytidylyltransferase [Candidatus Limnocylindrales bacterium]